MPEAKMPLRYERRNDPGRNGSAGTISILYKAVSYTEKEGDPMYNENEDVLILAGLDPEKMEFLILRNLEMTRKPYVFYVL